MVLIAPNTIGQTTVKLGLVEFSNSQAVTRDLGPVPQILYSSVWLDRNLDGDADDWFTDINGYPFAGDIRAPICYLASDPVSVSTAILLVNPAGAITLSQARLVGKIGPTGVFFAEGDEGALSYNGDGTQIIATVSGAGGGGFNTIKHVPDFSIQWRLEVASSPIPFTLATSKNHMHWVLLPQSSQFPLFYSLIDIGCRRANGLGFNDSAVAAAIFAEFATLFVTRASERLEVGASASPMTYWANWQTASFTLQGLLATGDGRCGAWSVFMIRCMHAVGIDPDEENIEVRLPAIPDHARYLLAPNWKPGSQRNADHEVYGVQYPYINIPEDLHPSPHYFIGPAQYHWRMNDFTDLEGITAQGAFVIPNPGSLVPNHAVVLVNGTYYDPSHGVTHTSESGIDNFFQAFALLFGYDGVSLVHVYEDAVGIDLDGDGVVRQDWSVPTKALMIQMNNPFGTDIETDPNEVVR